MARAASKLSALSGGQGISREEFMQALHDLQMSAERRTNDITTKLTEAISEMKLARQADNAAYTAVLNAELAKTNTRIEALRIELIGKTDGEKVKDQKALITAGVSIAMSIGLFIAGRLFNK